jgi:pyruvate carboxylase
MAAVAPDSFSIKRLLVANRGEIAIRLCRYNCTLLSKSQHPPDFLPPNRSAASEMGIVAVGIFSEDDIDSLHRFKADESVPLNAGAGAQAYLNIDAVIAAAKATACNAVHPGYGFLAENPEVLAA